jgi:hypothetical protein
MMGDLAEKLQQSINRVDRRGRSFAGTASMESHSGYEFGERLGSQRMRGKPKSGPDPVLDSSASSNGPLSAIVHDW